MVHSGEFLKNWSLRSSSVTRHVNCNRTKIGEKCQNSKATFWVIFKQCENEVWWINPFFRLSDNGNHTPPPPYSSVPFASPPPRYVSVIGLDETSGPRRPERNKKSSNVKSKTKVVPKLDPISSFNTNVMVDAASEEEENAGLPTYDEALNRASESEDQNSSQAAAASNTSNNVLRVSMV